MSNDQRCTIELNRGLYAVIDQADFERVTAYTWTAVKRGQTYYAASTIRQPDGQPRTRYLHAFITGWKQTDHINGDGLDNRRTNLREATQSQNTRNIAKRAGTSSQYKGVWKAANSTRWSAAIGTGGQRTWLGSYATEVEAAQAYDIAARKHHGEFAALNFPQAGERSALQRGDVLIAHPSAPEVAPERSERRRKACPNGHSYDDISPRITKDGRQHCRPCAADKGRRWRAKRARERVAS